MDDIERQYLGVELKIFLVGEERYCLASKSEKIVGYAYTIIIKYRNVNI